MNTIRQFPNSAVIICLTLVVVFSSACGSISTRPFGNVTADNNSEYLVGSYTEDNDQGIYKIRLDHKTGQLSDSRVVAATKNPTAIAWAEPRKVLLSVVDTMGGGVSSFSWDKESEHFDLIETQRALSDVPVFIGIDPKLDFFVTANYMSSDVQLFSYEKSGDFSRQGVIKYEGKGDHPRQDAPHLHWVKWGPKGKNIYAVDLGLDSVYKYRVESGTLVKKGVAFKTENGDGPRHMAFHPKLDRAYLLNELTNTILTLAVDKETGNLSELQRLSTLDKNFTEHNQAAAIKFSPDGMFVYVSNRGANTIAGYRIGKQGLLEYIGETTSVGAWPRDFHLSPDGKYLLVANQGSNSINVLERDVNTGRLKATQIQLPVHKPAAIIPF